MTWTTWTSAFPIFSTHWRDNMWLLGATDPHSFAWGWSGRPPPCVIGHSASQAAPQAGMLFFDVVSGNVVAIFLILSEDMTFFFIPVICSCFNSTNQLLAIYVWSLQGDWTIWPTTIRRDWRDPSGGCRAQVARSGSWRCLGYADVKQYSFYHPQF